MHFAWSLERNQEMISKKKKIWANYRFLVNHNLYRPDLFDLHPFGANEESQSTLRQQIADLQISVTLLFG